jgi:hypothetical protein
MREVTAIDAVLDDGSLFVSPRGTLDEGTPLELFKRDAELMGVECSACVLRTGQRADARHTELWKEREKGKKH